MKVYIVNDLNDILQKRVTHFSLDKGLYLGYGLVENGCQVYFLTLGESQINSNINFINIKEADINFLNDMDLIIIVRETEISNILENYGALKNIILNTNRKTKIMVKSDSVQWILDKNFRKYISSNFDTTYHTKKVVGWICKYFDYICVQTKEFRKDAVSLKIPSNKIIVTNMAISNKHINYDDLCNPYDINHNYCVKTSSLLTNDKALLPLYYCKNPDKIKEFNREKKILVYTGRMKTDCGKILYFMKEIMDNISDEYELHIFPGSFTLPDYGENNGYLKCSAINSNHLVLLRDTIFENSKNVIIHYPYEHQDMYKYLNFAYCGIDFSDVRPKHDEKSKAGHAKLLEYCSVGLPVVCEDNINNLFLIRNGKNGIILPYMSSASDYIQAIYNIEKMNVDRLYCRKITFNNESCVKRACELLNMIK